MYRFVFGSLGEERKLAFDQGEEIFVSYLTFEFSVFKEFPVVVLFYK